MSRDVAVPERCPRGTGGTDGGGRRWDKKSHMETPPLSELGLVSTLPRIQGFSSFPAVFTLLLLSQKGGLEAALLHRRSSASTALLSQPPLPRVPLWHTCHMAAGCSAPGLNLPPLQEGGSAMKEGSSDRSEEPWPRWPQDSPREKGSLCAKRGCGRGFALPPCANCKSCGAQGPWRRGCRRGDGSVNPGTPLQGKPPALSEFHEKCIGLLIILNETSI